ncbi:hypothetical protein COL32_08635 [Bacillus pseudomycoides]|nr:hypothetical protein CON70_04675 [Bacillus pseudomycoides]PFW89534.1 hypothetical protein COL29_24360 [Bacillus pseudomycoides]PFX46134.1 hypothetical protein COL32_08635 [Bacillus pseudomycoides]
MKRSVVMRAKGVLISFLVLITFLGFLPIEKASASASSNSVNEVADRIDTNKRYYLVTADSQTLGISALQSLLAQRHFCHVALVRGTGTSLKFYYSEENGKYRIQSPDFMIVGNTKIAKWISYSPESSLLDWDITHFSYWTITPVEGGYTIQAEDNGYLNYREVIPEGGSSRPGIFAEVSDKKLVWKLVPAS